MNTKRLVKVSAGHYTYKFAPNVMCAYVKNGANWTVTIKLLRGLRKSLSTHYIPQVITPQNTLKKAREMAFNEYVNICRAAISALAEIMPDFD